MEAITSGLARIGIVSPSKAKDDTAEVKLLRGLFGSLPVQKIDAEIARTEFNVAFHKTLLDKYRVEMSTAQAECINAGINVANPTPDQMRHPKHALFVLAKDNYDRAEKHLKACEYALSALIAYSKDKEEFTECEKEDAQAVFGTSTGRPTDEVATLRKRMGFGTCWYNTGTGIRDVVEKSAEVSARASSPARMKKQSRSALAGGGGSDYENASQISGWAGNPRY